MIQVAIFAGGVVFGAVIVYLLLKNRADQTSHFQQHLQSATEQLLLMAQQKLGADKEEIKTDLDHKKEVIKTMVDQIQHELRKTDERLRLSEQERISSFAALKEELQTHKQLTRELQGSTNQLKNILSNNQTRGAFGERIAEDLLKLAGFVVNQDYFVQLTEGESRPDFTIVLPDKTKINIDVKFPYQNLQRYVEAVDAAEKKRHLEQFQRDVREKIKQIANRNYINPDDSTVDFAVAFIPNEMIFSFTYEHLNGIWEEAMAKKVILAGPYSFVALLRLIKQAHANFKFSQNISSIIGLIGKFRSEYDKFFEEFDKVGLKLEAATKQFHDVQGTRHRQLTRVIDQIDGQQLPESSPPQFEN